MLVNLKDILEIAEKDGNAIAISASGGAKLMLHNYFSFSSAEGCEVSPCEEGLLIIPGQRGRCAIEL